MMLFYEDKRTEIQPSMGMSEVLLLQCTDRYSPYSTIFLEELSLSDVPKGFKKYL